MVYASLGDPILIMKKRSLSLAAAFCLLLPALVSCTGCGTEEDKSTPNKNGMTDTGKPLPPEAKNAPVLNDGPMPLKGKGKAAPK